jgi:hypothetical protein
MRTARRFRLTLTPHSLTLRRAFSTETIARSDITGYRKVKIGDSDPVLQVFSRGRKRPIIAIPWVLADENVLIEWFGSIET